MKNLSLTLSSLLVASATVFSAHAQEIKGDAKAGETKVAMCIGCHGIPGYQASFPEIHKVPMISGQNAKYLVAALNAYKKGDRKHPTMRAIAGSLSDQDMADLAAHYEIDGKNDAGAPPDVPKTEPTPQVAELLKKANCSSCHGANYNKPIDPSYPKIAGQHADYLYVALKAYHSAGNAQLGRNNAIMAGMAKQYSLNELKLISKYIGSLEGELKTVPQSRFR